VDEFYYGEILLPHIYTCIISVNLVYKTENKIGSFDLYTCKDDENDYAPF
jgi:hypothetical protein